MDEGEYQREQGEGLAVPLPVPLGLLPNQLFLLSDDRSGSIAFAMLSVASLFPYPHPYPAEGVLAIRHTNDCV